MTTEAGVIKPFYVWEGVYESFQSAAQRAQGDGFSGSTYSERSRAVARECLAALAEGTPIPPFHKQRSTLLPCTAAMIGSVKSGIRILDFGGGLGIGYMTLEESMQDGMHNIDYSIFEVPGVARIGKEMLGGKVTYLSGLEGVGKFDLIHAASSLQYVEDWKGLVSTFAGLDAEYLLLSDVFAGHFSSFVTLQNYYESKIPHWFLNFDELVKVFHDAGYALLMKTYAASRRVESIDILPMENFPENLRLSQSLHLLLQKKK
ncbi:methyltransferase, TIGR04325 family [Polaromonas sp.]|jgi:putative methyltransferase (TIGR04325 family)|uniref:methyltransferase, TIGR04325 family n=1 Tax=Polaromonas sp. TaxID=1869339 RepID=UPI0037CB50A1